MPSQLIVIPNRPVKWIILHCSASDIPNQTAAVINRWHKARGFVCIGYHYVIRTKGLIEQGRPLDSIGAHCLGYNKESIGICLVGLRQFFDAQFISLKNLLDELVLKYPSATLHGHCEFDKNGKTCPIYKYDDLVTLWDNARGVV